MVGALRLELLKPPYTYYGILVITQPSDEEIPHEKPLILKYS